MLVENVEKTVGNTISTKERNEFITIPRDEYNRLVYERDEYRTMCLDFAQRLPKVHEIADNIDKILAKKGGVINE